MPRGDAIISIPWRLRARVSQMDTKESTLYEPLERPLIMTTNIEHTKLPGLKLSAVKNLRNFRVLPGSSEIRFLRTSLSARRRSGEDLRESVAQIPASYRFLELSAGSLRRERLQFQPSFFVLSALFARGGKNCPSEMPNVFVSTATN